MQWQLDQWREQNLAILGRWREEKRRADEAEQALIQARADLELAERLFEAARQERDEVRGTLTEARAALDELSSNYYDCMWSEEKEELAGLRRCADIIRTATRRPAWESEP